MGSEWGRIPFPIPSIDPPVRSPSRLSYLKGDLSAFTTNRYFCVEQTGHYHVAATIYQFPLTLHFRFSTLRLKLKSHPNNLYGMVAL